MDRPTSRFSTELKEQIEKAHCVAIRDDVHGLDVFEDIEVRIFRVDAEGIVQASLDMFIDSIRDLLPLAVHMDEKERLCCQLINDSLFPATSEATLIVVMTAIEILCGTPHRT
jgi:hypothetical protein